MPTPVNHLVMARELLESGLLLGGALRLLQAHPGPFMLGHTAPDVQTVSGQRRGGDPSYSPPPP
ncbi:MAG: hypothetical protein N3B68_10710, partial [Anaerolineae bacterium]|nr:hypothetical protein [Anaerolineae bacterium]